MSTRLSNFMPPQAAAAPAAPAAAPAVFAAEIQLSKPILTHNDTITVLRLRVPSYGDLMDIGDIDRVYITELDPVTNHPKKMETSVDRSAVFRWIERLSGLDHIVLGQLSMQDGINIETSMRRILAAAQKGN